jgi:hypothetical protein
VRRKLACPLLAILIGAAGSELFLVSAADTEPDPAASGVAIEALRAGLASRKASLVELAQSRHAQVPLTKADAARARRLLWQAHSVQIAKDRVQEIRDGVLKDGTLEMRLFIRRFGTQPSAGRSLWISLHGGGGALRAVNDQQWENQKHLYALTEGLYVAPRAPTDTWNLWHERHIDHMFGRLGASGVVARRSLACNPDSWRRSWVEVDADQLRRGCLAPHPLLVGGERLPLGHDGRRAATAGPINDLAVGAPGWQTPSPGVKWPSCFRLTINVEPFLASPSGMATAGALITLVMA